jgi:hypothetical protein
MDFKSHHDANLKSHRGRSLDKESSASLPAANPTRTDLRGIIPKE